MERFYEPSEGQVLFNGHDIREFDMEWYHTQIGLVSQEPVLFSGTIRDNVLYGLDVKDKTETEIVEMLDEATKMSNAYEFIHDKHLFPETYETIVGERGVKLSGGQKQRIAIARALVRKPKVLLLDEATSALDAESEHQVQQALDKLINEGSQTVVVVAHRLSTIRHADEIIVMQKGEVKERGKHEELLELDGVYKNLVNRQLVSEQLQREEKEENEIEDNQN
jgi:ABC-type multidrug transport system fused ATPase/permease subunit